MREEIAAAAGFIARVLDASDALTTEDSLEQFQSCLSRILEQKFKGHWHTETPARGQAFRSIRIHPAEPLDPVLHQAACNSGIRHQDLQIPVELTVWVDPQEVCCRFGDLKATYCTVLTYRGGCLDNKIGSLDVRDLLDTAKAQYSRQQNIRIAHSSSPPLLHSSPSVQHDGSGFLCDFVPPHAGLHLYSPLDGFTSALLDPFPSLVGMDGEHFTPIFSSTTVHPPPHSRISRLSGAGGGGSIRKGIGGSTGIAMRGGKHKAEAGTFNHSNGSSHLGSLSSTSSGSNGSTHLGSGSTSNSGSLGSCNGRSGADRFHWFRSKGQHQVQSQKHLQQQQSSGSLKDAK